MVWFEFHVNFSIVPEDDALNTARLSLELHLALFVNLVLSQSPFLLFVHLKPNAGYGDSFPL